MLTARRRLGGHLHSGLWPSEPTVLRRFVHAAGCALLLVVVALAVHRMVVWGILNATWSAGSMAECRGDGACWAFVVQRLGQFAYGFYPGPERWRVDVAGAIFLAIVTWLIVPRLAGKTAGLLVFLFVFPFLAFWLLRGGMALSPVPTEKWGGLMLTLLIAASGLIISLPLGILVALSRASSRPWLCYAAIAYIEFWRGVPIVAVLILSIIVLPAILPNHDMADPLVLAIAALSLYTSAYFAEVVRGGLQTIPGGQFEAAKALGLGYWTMMGLIVLPQALRVSLPGIVNVSIALVKDTALVMVVGLFDLMSIVTAGVSDPLWLGASAEGYLFAGAIFWIVCFTLSTVSRWLERRGAAHLV